MNNNEKITCLTDYFMEEMKFRFKKAGYKIRTTKQSAIVQVSFIKDNIEISFSGWKKGVYNINYSIIHSMFKFDKETYNDDNLNIFTMPGKDPEEYGAGMVKDDMATDEELDAYNYNLKVAKEWVKKIYS